MGAWSSCQVTVTRSGGITVITSGRRLVWGIATFQALLIRSKADPLTQPATCTRV